MKKVYIIAGESSGDVLGAALMKSLKKKNIQLVFKGIGGPLMKDEGLISFFPMKDLAIMGVFEIIPHIFKLLKRIKDTVSHIIAEQPDVVITIDSPGFCKRVMERVQKKLKNDLLYGKKPLFFHYVAPSVWAWRPGRAKKIAKIADHLFCLLPFEPAYFTPHGLDATFVGHQLASNFVERLPAKANDGVNILLLPGSRKGEIERLLPIFLQVVKRIENDHFFDKPIHFILPTLSHVIDLVKSILIKYEMVESVHLVESVDKKNQVFEQAHFAIAASGTVSLELAKYAIPHVIAYKINRLTGYLIKFLLKTEYVALPNILSQREIVPECLQTNCNEEYIYEQFKKVVYEDNIPMLLQQAFLKLRPADNKSSSDICADVIYEKIGN
jgi:lipid-A-disaccharide synthase